jgi:osmotically-inducible protein OsmY
VVRDVKAKRHAEALARSVKGVIHVDNTLITDTAITSQVTTALLQDPRTEVAVIEVISERGVVTLKGKVDSKEIRDAAEEIARRQPGVIALMNVLEVEPDEDTPSLLHRAPGMEGDEPRLATAGPAVAHTIRSP